MQWALAVPQDWQPYEITKVGDVRTLPRKGVPATGAVVDQTPGWVVGANVQGVIFEGWDHVGVEYGSNLMTVKAWNDDSRSGWTVGKRYGQVWTFAPPAPDIKLKNAINTVQTCTWFGEGESDPVVLGGMLPVAFGGQLQPWTAFTATDARNTWHGIQLSQELWDAHVAARSTVGWTDWIGA